MTQPPLSLETLTAYADGELPPQQAEQVAARLAEDPQAQAQLAALRRAGEQAAAAFALELGQPLPPALRAAVQRMVAQAQAARRTPSPQAGARRWWQRLGFDPQPRFALAASALSAVVAVGAYWAGATLHPGAPPVAKQPFGVLALAPATLAGLAHALDAAPSGEQRPLPDGREVELLATFRDAGGVLCREFNLRAAGALTRAVACRGERWQATFAVAAATGDGYTPAAGPAVALEAYLEARGATLLSPAEEVRALRGR